MSKVRYLGPRKPLRISLSHLLAKEGMTEKELKEMMADTMSAPPLCSQCRYKWIEIDGECEHGNPSAARAMGYL